MPLISKAFAPDRIFGRHSRSQRRRRKRRGAFFWKTASWCRSARISACRAARVRKLEATKSKRATKRELIVVATMISRLIGTSLFSDRTKFSANLQRHHWTGRPVGTGSEFVGLCALYEETHPSFYVNPFTNPFYCHGCGRGGDLIRFLELSRHLSFRSSVA